MCLFPDEISRKSAVIGDDEPKDDGHEGCDRQACENSVSGDLDKSQPDLCTLASKADVCCGVCDCHCCNDIHSAHQPQVLDKLVMLQVHVGD